MGYPEFYLSYRLTKEIKSGVKLDEELKFSNRLSKFLSVQKLWPNYTHFKLYRGLMA